MFALDVEAAKHLGLAISAGAIILAVLAAIFVRAALAKAFVILLLGGFVVVAMGQRSNISHCAKRIEADYRSGKAATTTCKFLGRQFTVNVPATSTSSTDSGASTTQPG